MRMNVSSESQKKILGLFNMIGLLVLIIPSVIRETYENSEAFLAHLSNLSDLLHILYEKFASDHSVAIYGNPSQDLLEKINARGVDTKFFSFLKGL